MTIPVLLRLFLAWLVLFSLAQAVFALFPGLDLRVSALFFDQSGVFAATRGPVPLLNDITRTASEVLAFGVVLWFLVGLGSRQISGAGRRCAAYLAANVVLVPGLLVNGVLKSHVGRARPAQVTEFGGLAQFTPAWQVTDQCSRNCSFVSGDVAVITTLVLAGLVLSWPHLGRLQKALWFSGGAVAVVGVALMRLALGRHFLSDVVFAILFSAVVALALYPLLGIGQARRSLRPLDFARLRARLETMARSALARVATWLRA